MAKRGKKVSLVRRALKLAPKAFGLGIEITSEMWKDTTYNIMDTIATNLARAKRDAMEREAHAVLSEAAYSGRVRNDPNDHYDDCEADCYGDDWKSDWKTADNYIPQAVNAARGGFSSLLAPGLKQVYLQNYSQEDPMGKSDFFITTGKPVKKLVPRTKREKALVAQTHEDAWRAGHSKGFDDGQINGAEKERQRGERFVATLIEAQARGHRS